MLFSSYGIRQVNHVTGMISKHIILYRMAFFFPAVALFLLRFLFGSLDGPLGSILQKN